MSVTLFLASLALQGAAQPTVSPKELLGKCIARYATANTVRGRIAMTQTAAGKSVVIETGIQTQKPVKVRLDQQEKSSEGGSTLLTSDGTRFSYDPIPSHVLKMRRLVEPLVDAKGNPILNERKQPFGLGDIYIAMNGRLRDKNVWLDMIFGERSHLEAMRAKWATIVYRGRVRARGKDVYAISGDWRETAVAPPTGDFEMYLDDDFNLIRYVEKQRVGVPNAEPVEVTTIWDADLVVDGPVDESLFKVVL